MILCTNSMRIYIDMVKFSFTHICSFIQLDQFFTVVGFTYTDIILMVLGCVVLFLSDLCVYRGENIFKVMDRQNYLVKTAAIYAEVITIFIYGMVGSSAFIYFQF